ncbi:MAG: histidinol-phosphate transaminase [Actinobacteria bacterium]|nr:histidinol-phosphate transaminase [Actinomycetota bacterium]
MPADSVEDLIRPDILHLEEYEPVEPLEKISKRIGIPVSQIIKLDANENPYGPSPRVKEALAAHDDFHRYPDPDSGKLREAIAKYVGMDVDNILAGAGADELIELTCRLFLRPDDSIINNVPTFGMYSICAGINAGQVIQVRRREDYSLDVPAILAAVEDRTKIIFVASPNNPTGNAVTGAEITRLLETRRVVVVDEAYCDFAGTTVAGLVPSHENLVVLRTFSKLGGLAGFRVGYGLFSRPVLRQLLKIKQPYNVTTPAQIAALASLEDVERLQENTRAIVRERERLFQMLTRLDFIEPLPSQANFILCRVTKGNAYHIKKALERRGIFVRYFRKPLLENAIRISVGTPAQSDILVSNLWQVGEDMAKGRLVAPFGA